MKRGLNILSIAVLALIFVTASAAQAGVPEDAKALAQKAAAHYKKVGKEKAIADFQNPQGPFVKGELFIVVQDFKGIVYSHANKGLIGQNHLNLKDPTGKYFVQEMVEICKTKGSGWTSYSWTNPATKKVQPKKTWVQRVEGEDLYVLCGFYL